jgi:hypothetical protein
LWGSTVGNFPDIHYFEQQLSNICSFCIFIHCCQPWVSSIRFSAFLSAFAKLRKAAIGFVMSVRPSARMEQLWSHWTGLREIRYLSIFGKSVEKTQVSLKSDKNNRYFT